MPGGDVGRPGGAAEGHLRPQPRRAGATPAWSTEAVYDAAGRVVASRRNTEAWACTAYDARGRVSSRSVPAYGGEAARTVSYNYAVANNPLRASVADPAGTVATTVDLLGRVVSYTDVWNKTTTSTYDQAGAAHRQRGAGGHRPRHPRRRRAHRTQSLDGGPDGRRRLRRRRRAGLRRLRHWSSTAATAPRCRPSPATPPAPPPA